MKARFPLSAKILLWLSLNLLLLAVVLYTVFRIQFHFGLDSLLAGKAGDRIESVSNVIVDELNGHPRDEWNEILKRFSSAYQLEFFLFRNDGFQLAGQDIELPIEVRSKLLERGAPNVPLRPRNPGLNAPHFRGEPGPGPGGAGPPLEPPPHAGPLQPRPEGPPRVIPRSAAQHPKSMTRTSDPSRYWVLVRVPVADAGHARPIPATLVAMSNSLSAGGLFFEFTPWLVAGVGVVLFSVAFWLPLVRGITRSISRMTKATEQLAEGRFDVRVSGNRQDELGSLAQAVNGMAARLEGLVTSQKRFLGDTAHELCSPLARIQMALGILEQRADEKQKTYIEDLRQEVHHMSNLVNELLSFSKASLGASRVKLQPTPLRAVVEKAISREAVESAQIRINVADDLCVMADPELLVRSLANLLRNAVRYAGNAGPITISAARTDNEVVLTVGDCGPGVPEETLATIFDPFYRLDPSRDRETGGVGLGLAIVKTCVESCGGTVTCRNLKPSGLEVVIKLPAASEAASTVPHSCRGSQGTASPT